MCFLKKRLSRNHGLSLILIVVFGLITNLFANVTISKLNEDDDEKYNKGVTVSPSHLEFKVDLGKVATKKLKITNYTSTIQKFTMKYNDFDISLEGKSSFLDPGTSAHSLAKLLSIVPTFVELEPGKSMDVSVTIQVPNNPDANKAAWGVVLIEQAEEVFGQQLDIIAALPQNFHYMEKLIERCLGMVLFKIDLSQYLISLKIVRIKLKQFLTDR